jgi:maltose 6'-phosphate phosphatase
MAGSALKSLKVLTLNLHCYQQPDAIAKLERIADEIRLREIDVICFQEAAQHRDAAKISSSNDVQLKADNMVEVIRNFLVARGSNNYQFVWDWSHYGWDVWEEGVGILSRIPILNSESIYLTESSDKTDWLSRIAISAEIEISPGQSVQITSCHLGWFERDETDFVRQHEALWRFAQSKSLPSIVAGDFNTAAGTAGYSYLVESSKAVDCYLQANPAGMLDATIGGQIDGWEEDDVDGMRIDFIWLKSAPGFKIRSSEILFNAAGQWEVSDHAAVLVEFDFSPMAN